jgi:hypothetical protein
MVEEREGGNDAGREANSSGLCFHFSADNTLLSVAAISDTNVWAVGSESKTGVSPNGDHPLIEHWNGNTWSVSQSGTQTVSQTAFLNSVSASSANDV